MFRPQPMIQVDILLLQKDLAEATRALAGVNLYHLRLAADHGEIPAGDLTRQRLAARYRELADRLRHVLGLLGIEPSGGQYLGLGDFPLWERQAAELAARLERIIHRVEEVRRRNHLLTGLELLLNRINALEADVEELRTLRFSRLAVGFLAPQEWEKLLGATPSLRPWRLGEDGGDVLVGGFSSRRHASTMEQLLADSGFRALEIPRALCGPVQEARRRLIQLRTRSGQRIARLEAKLAGLQVENRQWLQDRLVTANAEQHLLKAQETFGFTERAAILSGWLPEKRLGDLQGVLEKVCGDRFVVRRAAARGEGVPVQLDNPALVRPFEKVLSVYGTPAYEEIEPTPLLAFGFLLMFGMMFGDLGQGLLLVAAGLLVRRHTRFRDQGLLVAEMGGFAALFGLLFGSFFGIEGLFPPLWFSPMHDIPLLMGAALFLGVAMVLTGLTLRILNGLRQGDLWALLTDRYGLAGLVFYGGAVATAVLVYLEKLPAASAWWLILPLAAIFLHPFTREGARAEAGLPLLLFEGAIEVMETVLGYLANTFSFLRVAAFGLAHVGLALAVFAVADRVQGAPLGILWAGLVQVTGNLVIVLLEGLIVSVQTVRLEFYEFFSKFFRGGGVAYRPLTLDSVVERRT